MRRKPQLINTDSENYTDNDSLVGMSSEMLFVVDVQHIFGVILFIFAPVVRIGGRSIGTTRVGTGLDRFRLLLGTGRVRRAIFVHVGNASFALQRWSSSWYGIRRFPS